MLLFYTTVSTILKQSHLGLVLALRTKAQKDTLLGSLPLTLVSLCLSLSLCLMHCLCSSLSLCARRVRAKVFCMALKKFTKCFEQTAPWQPLFPSPPLCLFPAAAEAGNEVQIAAQSVCWPCFRVPASACWWWHAYAVSRFSTFAYLSHDKKKRAGKAPTKQVTCSYSN